MGNSLPPSSRFPQSEQEGMAPEPVVRWGTLCGLGWVTAGLFLVPASDPADMGAWNEAISSMKHPVSCGPTCSCDLT